MNRTCNGKYLDIDKNRYYECLYDGYISSEKVIIDNECPSCKRPIPDDRQIIKYTRQNVTDKRIKELSETIASLYQSIQKAGGAINSIDLKEMTMIDFIKIATSNNIRFVYKGK